MGSQSRNENDCDQQPGRREGLGARERVYGLIADKIEEREAVIERVRSGELDLHSAWVQATEGVGGQTFVVKVVEAVPGKGKVAARRHLDALGIAHETEFARISRQQVEELAATAVQATIDHKA